MIRRILLASCGLVIAFGVGQSAMCTASAQEPKDSSFRGRLPAHYGEIVSEAQRQQIYAIQEKYAKQISALRNQLDAAENKRDAEIEAVLNAEQKGKLKKIRDDAAAKRKKGADKKVAEAKAAK